MKSFVKKFTRNTLFPLIVKTGIEKSFSNSSPFSNLVLCYHGVDKDGSNKFNGRHIAASVFEKHLIYFKRNFNVVTLEEIFKLKSNPNQTGKKTIAITFDDGYQNNYQLAFPVLKKHGLPATFFVSSITLEDPEAILWSDMIDLLRVETGGKIEFDKFSFLPDGPFRMKEKNSGQWLDDYFKELPPSIRDEKIAQIAKKYDLGKIKRQTDPLYWRMMTTQEIHEIAKSNLVEIGSHGHNHFNLGMIPLEKAKEEMRISKLLLETAAQRPVVSIAFPDGSYNTEVRKAAQELGYKYLLAVPYKLGDDPEYPGILRRSGVSGTTNYYSQIIHVHREFSNSGF